MRLPSFDRLVNSLGVTAEQAAAICRPDDPLMARGSQTVLRRLMKAGVVELIGPVPFGDEFSGLLTDAGRKIRVSLENATEDLVRRRAERDYQRFLVTIPPTMPDDWTAETTERARSLWAMKKDATA